MANTLTILIVLAIYLCGACCFYRWCRKNSFSRTPKNRRIRKYDRISNSCDADFSRNNWYNSL